jgi:dTDP-4-amino-4,6-dideoxygalactose transaminase
LKDFGRLEGIGGDKHDYFGINSKFTEIQATLGILQLKDVLNKINFKKNLYQLYFKNLAFDVPELHMKMSDSCWIPWFVDVYVQDREALIAYLKEQGIQVRAMYPQLTSQSIYQSNLNPNEYPNSATMAERGLWLPSSFDLTTEQVLKICMTIKEFYEYKK